MLVSIMNVAVLTFNGNVMLAVSNASTVLLMLLGSFSKGRQMALPVNP